MNLNLSRINNSSVNASVLENSDKSGIQVYKPSAPPAALIISCNESYISTPKVLNQT
jgi:hypothetical protein